MSWTVKDLADYHSKQVWIDSEFIDIVISKWTSYNKKYSYIFQNGRRIVLPSQVAEICSLNEDDSEFNIERNASALLSIIGSTDLTEAFLVSSY